jgi:O-antigen ligase
VIGLLNTRRLAVSSRTQEQLVVASPLLLALAAFVPTAGTLAFAQRADIGSEAAPVSWALIGLYLLSAAALFLASPRIAARTSRLNSWILALALLYWLTGGIATYANALSPGRLSFFVIPLVFVVSWRYRPRYRDAVAVLTHVTIAVCAASLLLALAKPSVAFTEPMRFATFLSSKRLAGIFEHPNAMGLFAAVGVVLAWRFGGWTRLLGFPVCAFALIASDSREAWFACAVAVWILLAGAAATPELGERTRRRLSAGWTPRRVLLLGTTVLIAVVAITSYMASEGDAQGLSKRTHVWHFVLENWSQGPIVGHGPDIWPSLIASGQVAPWVGEGHGQFFETLFTTGIVGVILLAGLLTAWTIKSVGAARRGHWLPLALQGLLVAYATLESPLSIWAVGPEVWLLSMILFLDPIADAGARAQMPPKRATLLEGKYLGHEQMRSR